MLLSSLESPMSMEAFSNLKARLASSFPKGEGPVYDASSPNLLLRAWSPAETRQVSWELYPGKLD